MNFDELAQVAEDDPRMEGQVTVRRTKRTHAGSLKEETSVWLTSMGYLPIESGWHGIDRNTAIEWLSGDLQKSLAYAAAMLKPDEALSRATAFFAAFDDGPTEFFASMGPAVSFEGGGSSRGGWPVTDSTMDSAYVVADNSHIGLFLFQDED